MDRRAMNTCGARTLADTHDSIAQYAGKLTPLGEKSEIETVVPYGLVIAGGDEWAEGTRKACALREKPTDKMRN